MWGVFLVFLLLRYGNCDVPGNLSSNPCSDHNHFLLAPGVMTAGGFNRACVSRFYTNGSARMVLALRTDDHKITSASRELAPGDGGCLDISVPQKPNTMADLTVYLTYTEAKCTWESSVKVRVSSGRLVAIHTDRARFRPGDTVRARVFALKSNLAPVQGPIDEVWLEGPPGAFDGYKVALWRRVPTRMGIAQVQHDLDPLAPTGRWTVRAKLSDGSQGTAAFLVSNYELPPFQMSVRHVPKVVKTSERLVWTVCVRYPWTEAVQGMLVIRIRGVGGSGGRANGIRTAVRLKAPRACHRHAAAAKRIGLNDVKPPAVIVADFSFQEEDTGIWQNTTVISQVVNKAISLEFLTKNHAVISPGLPYKLKVKANRWDETPPPNERVKVCRSPVTFNVPLSAGSKTCNDAVTDAKGIARVMFEPASDRSSYFMFEAFLVSDNTVAASPLQLPAHYGGSVHAALGALRADKQSDKMLVPLYLTLQNMTKPITVHFVVVTKGGIIYRWGATTQCPLPNNGDSFQIASRDGHCNGTVLDVEQKPLDTNSTEAEKHMLRVMLPIKVTHQMCPDSHLVAYFYYGDELVSASKHFEMKDCFANKVETAWLPRQVAPGSIAHFEIRADSRSLCALSALDIAAKVQDGPTTATALLSNLKKLLESQRKLTEYDAAGQCLISSESVSVTSSLQLTSRWLAAAGVRLVGGGPSARVCDPAPERMLNYEPTVPRSDFSEAWLWRLVEVGANGTTIANARAPDSISKFEASAICVSKSGLAMSTPTTLQVFREFFIYADGPRRLHRGDDTIIRYRLFNYLYEPLSVQIQILTDPHLEGPTEYVETACVAGREAAARHVAVRARLPGPARLSIRAKAVKDANCGNVTSSRTGLSDEVIIKIQVDPEGVPVHDHQSALLCADGSVESTNSEVTWRWSRVAAVPGSKTLTLWVVGNMAGPLLTDADSLVLLPRGCGEQNMARLATNLLALTQLSPDSPAAATAKEHIIRGFTRQLKYVHQAGGFSGFGTADPVPSTWLTAFSLKYLRKAHQILSPGLPAPPALEQAEQWMLKQQMENGCFRNEGQVFHKELKGGLNVNGEIANVALTAYVIATLAESSRLAHGVAWNGLSCLRALPPININSPNGVYAQALLAYTFMRLRRYEDDLMKSNEASPFVSSRPAGLEDGEELKQLYALLKVAHRTGEYVWWETSSLASSVEATGYALLTLSLCPADIREAQCAAEARGAVRWLATKANPNGGFISTQDTLIALEALTAWLQIQPLPASNLTVLARSGHSERTVRLQPAETAPDLVRMELSDELHVAVTGSGCALVHATRSYHTLQSDAAADKRLAVRVAVRTDGQFACDSNNTACFCAAVVEPCVVWVGTFPEMALLEVSLPGGYTADASLLYAQMNKPGTILRRIELSATNSRVTMYLRAQDGRDALGAGGHSCFSIHAMGPQVRTKPASARILDYYAPSVNDTQMYTIPEDCPPRVANYPYAEDYVPTDNLYAKSLSDSGEILIIHDSSEDMPEGIPLDDPMYADNLVRGKESDEYNDIVEPKVYVGKHTIDKYVPISIIDNKELIDQQNKKTGQDYTRNVVKLHGDEIQQKYSEVKKFQKEFETEEHKIEERANKRKKNLPKPKEDKPNLASFYVIESDKDLDVPAGIEGPIPAIVLPPENFVPVTLPPSVPDNLNIPERAGPPYDFQQDMNYRRFA